MTLRAGLLLAKYAHGLPSGIVLLVLSCLLFGQASCRTDAAYHQKLTDESYGPDVRNKMDVYLPSRRDSTTKTVILIHGGGWVAGDKKDFGNSEIANNLLQDGFVVASINYRYACGDFYKQMEDIHLAIHHIRSKSQQWEVYGNAFALVGGSAGGHLALLYAHAFDTLKLVKAVVSIVGPTDLTDTLFHRYASNYHLEGIFEQLLGASIQNNLQVYRDASPLFNRDTVPTLFICGKLDDLVPYQQSVRMHDSLTADGVSSHLLVLPKANHNVFGEKNENAREVVYSTIANWMSLYLRSSH